jgi:hypothetical protein
MTGQVDFFVPRPQCVRVRNERLASKVRNGDVMPRKRRVEVGPIVFVRDVL